MLGRIHKFAMSVSNIFRNILIIIMKKLQFRKIQMPKRMDLIITIVAQLVMKS